MNLEISKKKGGKITNMWVNNMLLNNSLFNEEIKGEEFLSWHSGIKSDQEPWGCGFDPWPRSVGQGTSVPVSCGVGRRRSSDLALLWLWHRPAATSPIRLLAWEPPYAMGAALEKDKKQTNKKQQQKNKCIRNYSPIIIGHIIYNDVIYGMKYRKWGWSCIVEFCMLLKLNC